MIHKTTLTALHALRIIWQKWFAFGLKLIRTWLTEVIRIWLEIDSHLAMRIRLFPALIAINSTITIIINSTITIIINSTIIIVIVVIFIVYNDKQFEIDSQVIVQSAIMDQLIAAVGAILFSLFIIYDTHMIMHRVSPEDYMFATINLYLDILNLFLHLLRLLSKREWSLRLYFFKEKPVKCTYCCYVHNAVYLAFLCIFL